MMKQQGAVNVMAGYEGYYPIHRLVYEREGAKNFKLKEKKKLKRTMLQMHRHKQQKQAQCLAFILHQQQTLIN